MHINLHVQMYFPSACVRVHVHVHVHVHCAHVHVHVFLRPRADEKVPYLHVNVHSYIGVQY